MLTKEQTFRFVKTDADITNLQFDKSKNYLLLKAVLAYIVKSLHDKDYNTIINVDINFDLELACCRLLVNI